MPALPEAPTFQPRAVAAQESLTRLGDDAWDAHPKVQQGSGRARLDSEAEHFRWAVYEFSLAPLEQILSVSYELERLEAGERAWLAISDYSEGRWQFFPASELSAASHTLPGPSSKYLSPGGSAFVALVSADGHSFDIVSVSLQVERWTISGYVFDEEDHPLAGVRVDCVLAGLNAFTDDNGYYELVGVPSGNWFLVGSKPGFTVFELPTQVIVNFADTQAPDMLAQFDKTHYAPIDPFEPNDEFADAKAFSPDQEITSYLSNWDDQRDRWKFEAGPAGWYVFEILSDANGLLFPSLNAGGVKTPYIMSGYTACSKLLTANQEVSIEVTGLSSFEGGEYRLLGRRVDAEPLAISGRLIDRTFTDEDITSQLVELHHNGELLATAVTNGKYSPDPGNPYYFTSLPAGEYQVKPVAGDWDFTPASQTVALDTMDVTGINFDAEFVTILDDHEPNNTPETAAVLELPALEVGNLLLGPRDLDADDFFLVEPAPGQALRVVAEYDMLNSFMIFTQLFDADTSLVVQQNAQVHNNRMEMRVADLAQEYLLRMAYGSISSVSRVPYDLAVTEFKPYYATFRCELEDGRSLSEAWIRFSDESLSYSNGATSSTDEGLLSWPLMDGETVCAELFRFGCSIDRQTQMRTIAGQDIEIVFTVPLEGPDNPVGPDNYEPNDALDEAKPVDLDTGIEATVGVGDLDYYIINPTGDADPLVSLMALPGSAGTGVSVRLYTFDGENWNQYGSSKSLVPGLDDFLDIAGAEPHIMRVAGNDIHYRLTFTALSEV